MYNWSDAKKDGQIVFRVLPHRDLSGEPSSIPGEMNHRLIKGLSARSPDDQPDIITDAPQESIYRWWYEFLRLSYDYWFICQLSEQDRTHVLDKELLKVYDYFGDIFYTDFPTWWDRTGLRIFNEKFAVRVREIDLRKPTLAPPISEGDHRILVEIPVELSSSEIDLQLKAIIRARRRQRTNNRFDTSNADFRVARPACLKTLKQTYYLCALDHELKVTNQRAQVINFELWHLTDAEPVDAGVEEYDSITQRVSHKLREGANLIRNAELGLFPNTAPALGVERFQRFPEEMRQQHDALKDTWNECLRPFSGTLMTERREDFESKFTHPGVTIRGPHESKDVFGRPLKAC